MSVQPRVCAECGAPRPKGRTTYCSNECAGVGIAKSSARHKERRNAPCQRCGQPKELGVRGARFCMECRRLVETAHAAMETERGRRRNIARNQERFANGERLKYRDSEAAEGEKWCARCQEFRPISSFSLRKNPKKPSSYCAPCQRSYNSERRIQIVYGLTWDEYEMLYACQDGRCAICGGRPRKHMLSVDHDHKTGEIRGLLCSRCNHRLLGSANDDPARLRKAADYLEAYGPREVFGEAKHMPGTRADS